MGNSSWGSPADRGIGVLEEWPALPALARVIEFKVDNPIFGTPNDPVLISQIARSGPGSGGVEKKQ